MPRIPIPDEWYCADDHEELREWLLAEYALTITQCEQRMFVLTGEKDRKKTAALRVEALDLYREIGGIK